MSSQSIRISNEAYAIVKKLAKENGRNIITELNRLILTAVDRDVDLLAAKQLRALKKYSGLISSLEPGAHGQSIDATLYGDDC